MHWKKICTILLTITTIMCTQSVFIPQNQCIVANAAEYYVPDQLIPSYVKRAEEHLAEIESDFTIATSGQAGLLTKLDDIQRYGMALYYLDYYRSSLNLQGVTDTNSEINFYMDKFVGMCKIFDSNFGNKSTSYTALKLEIVEDNCNTDKALRKTIKDLCTNTIPTYLSTLLQDTKNATSSLDITKTTANYGVFLSNICMVLDNMEDMSDDLTNISPFLSQADVTNTIDFNTRLNTSKAYALLRADYANLLDIGNDVLQMTGTTAVLSIDTSIGYVANMANVTENSGNIIIPSDVQLSQAYLAILSAGSTYVPFSSYVGDSSFISALKSLVSDPTAVDPLVSFYDDTKSFRKPLYRRALSNEGVPTGKAELITVNEFLADIESGAEGALVTVSGKFTYDTNNNYWVYADTYSTNNDSETITNRTESESFVDSANESLESDGLTSEEASDAIEEVHGDLGEIQKTVGANDVGELLYVTYQPSGSNATATYEFSMSSSKCTLTYDKGNSDTPVSKSELFVIQKPGTAILSMENDLNVPISMRFTNDPDFVDFCNQSNGSYNSTVTTDTDWVPNEKKINDLCNYVNRQVKHFVFNMEDQIGALSDDTMIKIITLRELTAFTQYVSDMGHWLYPYSLNYSEMNMLDVLNCILVDDYYTFVSKQLNICSYVLDKYGWMHLILFDALVIFLFVVCTVVHFIVPIMYLLLGILLIIKILSNSDVKIPIKGYLKCTVITMLCSTLLCIGIVLTSKWNDSVLCLYFLTAVVILTATVLTTILSSLIGNIADFGNTALNAKLEGIQSTFNKYSSRTATTTILTGSMDRMKGAVKNTRTEVSDLISKYSNDRSVDDFYDDSPQAYDYYSDPRFNGYDEDDYDYFIEPEVIYSDQEDYQL